MPNPHLLVAGLYLVLLGCSTDARTPSEPLLFALGAERPHWVRTGADPGERFGGSLALCDADGDGREEIYVGSLGPIRLPRDSPVTSYPLQRIEFLDGTANVRPLTMPLRGRMGRALAALKRDGRCVLATSWEEREAPGLLIGDPSIARWTEHPLPRVEHIPRDALFLADSGGFTTAVVGAGARRADGEFGLGLLEVRASGVQVLLSHERSALRGSQLALVDGGDGLVWAGASEGGGGDDRGELASWNNNGGLTRHFKGTTRQRAGETLARLVTDTRTLLVVGSPGATNPMDGAGCIDVFSIDFGSPSLEHRHCETEFGAGLGGAVAVARGPDDQTLIASVRTTPPQVLFFELLEEGLVTRGSVPVPMSLGTRPLLRFGDVNGNGAPDLVVGMPGFGDSSARPGAVLVLFDP